MKLPIKTNGLLTLSSEFLVSLSFICYFCAPLIRIAIKVVLGSLLGTQAVRMLTILVIYAPLIMACIIAPRKHIKADFIFLWLFVGLLFLFSYLTHDEYEYWYTRDNYGVWDYVLVPTEGLYAYLFIRLMDDPAKIKKNLKIAGWLMLIYFTYQLSVFFSRGYWVGIGSLNNNLKMDHSVSFGYNVMFFGVVFLYDALSNLKKQDIIAAGIYIVYLFLSGTRGPVLFVAVFVFLYALIYVRNMKNGRKQLLFYATISLACIALFALYDYVLLFLSQILSRWDSTARIINALINGSFMEDNGRFGIWEAAINMIRENPWGYGPMGSQPVISKLIYVGYPHSVILEVLIDFGVVVGGAILLMLGTNSVSMLFNRKNKVWTGVFLVFFASACQLFISLCYWSAPAFWCCIAVGVNCKLSQKGKGRIINKD